MSTGERGEGRGLLRVRPSRGQTCWIAILVLIGVVQVVRDQPFDVVYFAAAAAVTTLDATGLLSPASVARRVSGRVLLGAGAVAAAAIGLLPRHEPAMIAVMLVLGATVLVLVWPGGGVRRPWGRGIRTLAWCWAVIVVIGCLWELLAFLIELIAPSAGLALSDLLNPVLALPIGQAVFAIAWVALGVWLVRRTVRR